MAFSKESSSEIAPLYLACSHTASAPSSGQPIARPDLAAACMPGIDASQFAAMMRWPV